MENSESLPDCSNVLTTLFFLFGPRGAGKTTWLKQVFDNALHLDLLDASLHLELSKDPHRLEAMTGELRDDDWVVLDEIQKNPALLDEVETRHALSLQGVLPGMNRGGCDMARSPTPRQTEPQNADQSAGRSPAPAR
ncbi:AAA family ATPase [Desulfonatronum thiosulfatophilum]|uniref:AAA family ATPase n=1 Tax=Desulfonatronum thiosulfatophilum TaxID=617002 RepID=UPI000B85F29D